MYMDKVWQSIYKKEDTPTNYFTKTEYWRPLVPNAESVDKTNI